jgi:histidyl-tRNA synthetase
MRQADRLGVAWTVIVGPDEWSREVATIRDMRGQEQDETPITSLEQELLQRAGGEAARR